MIRVDVGASECFRTWMNVCGKGSFYIAQSQSALLLCA